MKKEEVKKYFFISTLLLLPSKLKSKKQFFATKLIFALLFKLRKKYKGILFLIFIANSKY